MMTRHYGCLRAVTIMQKLSDRGENRQAALTLTDKVTSILQEKIRSGIYPVNARLPTEKFMTAEYGVSRTVIREAIARLNSERLVETRQGSGTVVLPPSTYETFRLNENHEDPVQAVIHVLELRHGIEAEMAALAASRHTQEQLSAIEQALERMDSAVAAGGDGVREDLSFHLAIAHATNNPNYPALLRMLTRALEDAIRVTRGNEATVSKLANQVCREHQSIRDAIVARDPHTARTVAFQHMSNTARRILDAKDSYWMGPNGQVAQRLARTGLLDGLDATTK